MPMMRVELDQTIGNLKTIRELSKETPYIKRLDDALHELDLRAEELGRSDLVVEADQTYAAVKAIEKLDAQTVEAIEELVNGSGLLSSAVWISVFDTAAKVQKEVMSVLHGSDKGVLGGGKGGKGADQP